VDLGAGACADLVRYAEAALIGCELEVIGPWLAEGTVGEELQTSDPTLHAYPVEFPGGTLILLMCIKDDTQYHVGSGWVDGATIQLPRALKPDERVYQLTLLEGARDITWRLQEQNTRTLRLKTFRMTDLLLITGNEQLIRAADEQFAHLRPDAGRFQALAASAQVKKVRRVAEALQKEWPLHPPPGYPRQSPLMETVRSAEIIVGEANEHIERGDYREAFLRGLAARGILRFAVHSKWQDLNRDQHVQMMGVLPNLYLAEKYYPIVKRLEGAQFSQNLVANASFEEGEGAAAASWMSAEAVHEQKGKCARSNEYARRGEYSLRLVSESPAIYEGHTWRTRLSTSSCCRS